MLVIQDSRFTISIESAQAMYGNNGAQNQQNSYQQRAVQGDGSAQQRVLTPEEKEMQKIQLENARDDQIHRQIRNTMTTAQQATYLTNNLRYGVDNLDHVGRNLAGKAKVIGNAAKNVPGAMKKVGNAAGNFVRNAPQTANTIKQGANIIRGNMNTGLHAAYNAGKAVLHNAPGAMNVMRQGAKIMQGNALQTGKNIATGAMKAGNFIAQHGGKIMQGAGKALSFLPK